MTAIVAAHKDRQFLDGKGTALLRPAPYQLGGRGVRGPLGAMSVTVERFPVQRE